MNKNKKTSRRLMSLSIAIFLLLMTQLTALVFSQTIERKIIVEPAFLYELDAFPRGYYISPQEAFVAHQNFWRNYNPTGQEITLYNFRPAARARGQQYINGKPNLWVWNFKVEFNGVTISDQDGDLYVGFGQVYMNTYCPSDINFTREQGATTDNNVTVTCTKTLTENQDPPPQSCPATNKPVYGETGLKRQREDDFIDPQGLLSFSRTWRSDQYRFFHTTENTLISNTTVSALPGCFPSYYEIPDSQGGMKSVPYCFPYMSDGSNNQVQFILPNGNRNFYNINGNQLIVDADVNDKLTRNVDAQGVVTWTLMKEDNSVEIYDSKGLLIQKQILGGKVVHYTYSDSNTPTIIAPRTGLAIAMNDDYGRSVRMTYNSDGNIKTVTDPAGGLIEYFYDEANSNCPSNVKDGKCWRLTSVKYPDGGLRRYHYNEPANVDASLPKMDAYLTGITDENNSRLSTYQYDAQGRATSSGWAGNDYHLNYGSNQTTVTDPLGTERTYFYQEILGRKRPISQSQPGGIAVGGAKRLARDFTGRFGDAAYAFEELIAELGSAFMLARLGLRDGRNELHASYIDSWLRVLKNDKGAIFTAASRAHQAYQYLVDLAGIGEAEEA